jgi:transcriptional regulator with XRE-family HTH domain
MNTTGKRLTYLIEKQGIKIKEFCEKNNLLYNSIHPICRDKRELGINILNKLVDIFPDLNVNWLLYGKGKQEIIIYDIDDNLKSLQESGSEYSKDPVENTFLVYLDKKSIRKKVLEIVNDEKK